MFRFACLLLIFILICSGCINDRGNYDYIPQEKLFPVVIKGLPADTSFRIWTDVVLEADVRGLDDKSDYEFTWYSYTKEATGYIPKRDTLGKTQTLNFTMGYPVGEEKILVFEIVEKQTGLSVNYKLKMRSTTEFSNGWFILEDLEDMTDIDFVLPSGEVRENVYSSIHKKRLPGKGVKMIYQSSRYAHYEINPDATLTHHTNLKAFHLLTTADLKTLNPEDLTVYKNFEEQFMQLPEKCAPQDIYESWGDTYLINDGKLYSISGMLLNSGKYAYHKLDYADLFPHLIYSNGVVAFSLSKRSFVYTDAWSSLLSPVSAPLPVHTIKVPAVNMNAEVYWMGSSGGGRGWALMKDVSGKNEFYLAKLHTYQYLYPFGDLDTLSVDRPFLQADVYGVHSNSSIWYARQNILSFYQHNGSDSNSTEEVVYTFPEGEAVSFIRTISSTEFDPVAFKHLVVLTNANNRWKLYRFTMEADGLTARIDKNVDPIIYTGSGNARYVLYHSI